MACQTHCNAEGGGLIITASSNPGNSTIRVWSIDEKVSFLSPLALCTCLQIGKTNGFCDWKGLKAATYSRLQKLLFLVIAFQALCFICFLAVAINIINTHRTTLLSEAFWLRLLAVPEPVPAPIYHAAERFSADTLPTTQKALSIIYL